MACLINFNQANRNIFLIAIPLLFSLFSAGRIRNTFLARQYFAFPD